MDSPDHDEAETHTAAGAAVNIRSEDVKRKRPDCIYCAATAPAIATRAAKDARGFLLESAPFARCDIPAPAGAPRPEIPAAAMA
jgi:hypothetical protein